MRQNAARLNRAWLSVLGLLALLAGLAVVTIGAGLLPRVTTAPGTDVTGPRPSSRLFGSATASALSQTWVVLVVAAVGVVLALLALAWLLAQVPRTNQAKPFRLHDDPAAGLTSCSPGVLADAVRAQVEALPEVQAASAVIRGTAAEPDLTVKVTAGDRADLPRLLHRLQTEVAADLAGALDTRLARLGVQVEVGSTPTAKGQVVLLP